MFPEIQEGAVVLLELPSRWYLGRVARRGSIDCTLDEAAIVHQIGDVGEFLSGVLTESTEVSPLPRPVTVAFGSIDTCQALDPTHLRTLRVRTHELEKPRR